MKRYILLSLTATLLEANWSSDLKSIEDSAKILWQEQSQKLLHKEVESNSTVSYQEIKKEHFDNIWNSVIDKLQEALEISQKIDKAPSSRFFGEDKESLQREFDGVLDEIIMLLLDDNLINYRKTIRDAKDDIVSLERDILSYREQSVTAPKESHLKTTKSGYTQKIDEAKEKIAQKRETIKETKLSMSQNFALSGLNLTPVQIDVLLSRVDGDDIIAMTLMMDVLKEITSQLLGIMQESGEELEYAKKYYGMHTVLLQLVVYLQQNLIDKIEANYIPKIDTIIEDTKSILAKTDKKISSEDNLQRKSIYYKNFEAQKMTLRVATLYKKNLKDELKQIRKAQVVSRKNFDLSKNTFETVRLSSDLFKVISTSQEMLKEVMKLQIPTIVPFQNIEIQKKFQELTDEMSR